MIRSTLASILASLVILASCASATVPSPVQPMTLGGEPFCTAFSINQRDGYWATAKHCAEGAQMAQAMAMIMGAEAPALQIGGSTWVEIVYVDTYADIAILRSDLKVKPFPLAKTPLRTGDPVVVWGMPYGLGAVLETRGTCAAPGVPIPGAFVSDILDVTVGGGNSGSPVLRKGEVVGIVWGGFKESPHALSTTQADTLRVLGPYIQS